MNPDSEDLDPRIQVELDALNKASTDINLLEKSLDEERRSYETLFAQTRQNYDYLQSKFKTSIEKARPYYQFKEEFKKAQVETQAAAHRFDRAMSNHAAAQQMVAVAEAGFHGAHHSVASHSHDSTETSSSSSPRSLANVDLAWQEMLNVAVAKVNEAEKEFTASSHLHEAKLRRLTEVEGSVKGLYKEFRGAIKKSARYYEARTLSEFQLEEQSRRIKHIETKLYENKQRYAQGLKNLEHISEEIHYQREKKLGRGQGVGAESNEEEESQPRDSNSDQSNHEFLPMPEHRMSPTGAVGDLNASHASLNFETGTKSHVYSPLTPQQAKEILTGRFSTGALLKQIEEDEKSSPKSEFRSQLPTMPENSQRVAGDMKSMISTDLTESSESLSGSTRIASLFSTPEKKPSRSLVHNSRLFSTTSPATIFSQLPARRRTLCRAFSDETLYRSSKTLAEKVT